MPDPVLKMTRDEIRQEAIRLIADLEGTSARHPSWAWPTGLLPLAREFHVLASAEPLDVAHIRDFRVRLAHHIATERLKGFDEIIWYANTLEQLAGGSAYQSSAANAG